MMASNNDGGQFDGKVAKIRKGSVYLRRWMGPMGFLDTNC